MLCTNSIHNYNSFVSLAAFYLSYNFVSNVHIHYFALRFLREEQRKHNKKLFTYHT